ITAQPPHREIEKTALGATESVDWKYFNNPEEAVTILKQLSYEIIAIEQAEESIYLEKIGERVGNKKKKYAVVFGHEMHGVSNAVMNLADTAIEIPQAGTKHSLNISVCAGIVLWEFFKALKKST